MFDYYVKVLKNYATFSGRARRKEYWMFALCNFFICILLGVLMAVLGVFGIVLYVLYGLGIIIPSLAVLVRRLHDTNRSGAWFFISLVPLVGGIWLLILTFLEGTRGDNNYGPDPKA